MERQLFQKLLAWKNNLNRKPLVLQGARQVGKTYLINEFGKKAYFYYIYLNFEKNYELHKIFHGNIDPYKLISKLSLFFGQKIRAKNTLLFFDEIQNCPRALTSLKYFQEEAPEFHIIGAGSLLGIHLGKKSSFPVGKVNFLNLYPLSFREFLKAMGEDLILNYLNDDFDYQSQIPEVLFDKLNPLLKLHLFLGGMPEVVDNYIKNQDIKKARKIQTDIIQSYEQDFSKYTAPRQAINTADFWNSIPFQLAKENKKFKYSDIRKGGRSSTFDQTLRWLINAGLIHPVYNLRTIKMPLNGFADFSKFKVYMNDTGLLGAMLKLEPKVILEKSHLFSDYNGAFIENFVAVELIKNKVDKLFYWTSGNTAEVDFILQYGSEIIPLEVKSGTNKSIKSLQVFNKKYNPNYLVRTSPRNFIQRDNFTNIPLFLIDRIFNIIL